MTISASRCATAAAISSALPVPTKYLACGLLRVHLLLLNAQADEIPLNHQGQSSHECQGVPKWRFLRLRVGQNIASKILKKDTCEILKLW